jgi:phosphate transport system protein
LDEIVKIPGKLERDLTQIRDNVLRLGHMTAHAVEQAMRALKERDMALARQVVADDQAINQLRFKIEEECYHLMAMQQPMARDMRSLVTAVHLVVELERIADYAAGIAKLTLELEKDLTFKVPPEMLRMGDISLEMIRASIDAYVDWDAEKAQAIYERDGEVDKLDKKTYHTLLNLMINDPSKINVGTYLLWTSHNIERIADRVTNICERVIYMVTGNIRTENEG